MQCWLSLLPCAFHLLMPLPDSQTQEEHFLIFCTQGKARGGETSVCSVCGCRPSFLMLLFNASTWTLKKKMVPFLSCITQQPIAVNSLHQQPCTKFGLTSCRFYVCNYIYSCNYLFSFILVIYFLTVLCQIQVIFFLF